MSKICNECNTENVDEAKFCRKCGKKNFQIQEDSDKANDTYTEEYNNYSKSQDIIAEDISDVKKIAPTYAVHPDYIHYRAFMKEMFEKYGF